MIKAALIRQKKGEVYEKNNFFHHVLPAFLDGVDDGC